MRQIVLDTETTGLHVEEGHRIIEIACLEMINRRLTGKTFHHYIHPQREVEAGAFAIHGISNEFLRDKPLFNHVAEEFLAFINGAELIIHNAPFDVSFLNHELLLAKANYKSISDYCNVIDTLQIARKLHAGQRNSLDALCKRYGVDNSRRDLHGALIDTDLLAQVYLSMTGGQETFFDNLSANQQDTNKNTTTMIHQTIERHNLIVLHAEKEELEEHAKYLELLEKQR
jgi:DNA polymerase III subunit epsilon